MPWRSNAGGVVKEPIDRNPLPETEKAEPKPARSKGRDERPILKDEPDTFRIPRV